MKIGYVTHEEAMINRLSKDPEYADELLNAILADGDDYEIQRIQYLYNEAQARRSKTKRWAHVAVL